MMTMLVIVVYRLISGRVRNIYFPFDIESDTALSVATEMVAELDITDQDVTKIAEMIDGEIAALVPEWKAGFGLDESPNIISGGCCQNCDLPKTGKNVHILECPKHGCGSVHGRFEEITYQVEGSEHCATDSAPLGSSQSDHDESLDHSSKEKTEGIVRKNGDANEHATPTTSNSVLNDDYENELRQELRWFKAKYKMQLRELTDKQLGFVKDHHKSQSLSSMPKGERDEFDLEFSSNGKHFTRLSPTDSERNTSDAKAYNYESSYNSCSPVHFVTAKSFYNGGLLPNSLHRASSLPVDATEL